MHLFHWAPFNSLPIGLRMPTQLWSNPNGVRPTNQSVSQPSWSKLRPSTHTHTQSSINFQSQKQHKLKRRRRQSDSRPASLCVWARQIGAQLHHRHYDILIAASGAKFKKAPHSKRQLGAQFRFVRAQNSRLKVVLAREIIRVGRPAGRGATRERL